MTRDELDALKSCAAVLFLVLRRERGEFNMSPPSFVTMVEAALERARGVIVYYTPGAAANEG